MANGEGQQHYRYNTGTSRAKKNKRIPTKRNDARAGTERVLRHFPLDRSRRIMLVFIRSNIDMLSLLVRRAEERRRPCCGKGGRFWATRSRWKGLRTGSSYVRRNGSDRTIRKKAKMSGADWRRSGPKAVRSTRYMQIHRFSIDMHCFCTCIDFQSSCLEMQ